MPETRTTPTSVAFACSECGRWVTLYLLGEETSAGLYQEVHHRPILKHCSLCLAALITGASRVTPLMEPNEMGVVGRAMVRQLTEGASNPKLLPPTMDQLKEVIAGTRTTLPLDTEDGGLVVLEDVRVVRMDMHMVGDAVQEEVVNIKFSVPAAVTLGDDDA
jgi:hypothetical protein